jgi:hypothetical protein
MLAASNFWDAFFLLLIWVPLLMVWAFALVDIFRRDDIGGGSKALWVACVILVPFFGTFVYLIARPGGATSEERVALSSNDTASQLQKLADLHDRGKLTDGEFAAEKARVLGSS